MSEKQPKSVGVMLGLMVAATATSGCQGFEGVRHADGTTTRFPKHEPRGGGNGNGGGGGDQ